MSTVVSAKETMWSLEKHRREASPMAISLVPAFTLARGDPKSTPRYQIQSVYLTYLDIIQNAILRCSTCDKLVFPLEQCLHL